MTDKELVLQLVNNNHDAFKAIYEKYVKQVANFCTLYVQQKHIEEIVQEVFIKLWLNRASLNEDKSLKGYLFIITRNLIFDKFRKKATDYYTVSLLDVLEEASDENVEEHVYTEDLVNHIEELVNELPPRCKQIFLLSRKEHFTNKEIAEELDITIKTVEAAITRALKHLRECLILFFIFNIN